jgi:hypothetical protein
MVAGMLMPVRLFSLPFIAYFLFKEIAAAAAGGQFINCQGI